MVPSTPAQVGALEVGALAALQLLHVDKEPALAFALLYHAAQVLPLIAAGLLFELRLVLGRDVDAPASVSKVVAEEPPVLPPVARIHPSHDASSPP